MTYVTRAVAERDGLRLCESDGVDLEDRTYSYEHARDVFRNLDYTPVVADAEVTIGFSTFVDGYIWIGDTGHPDRITEVFDNYHLEPPLEMYCHAPGVVEQLG